MAQLALSEAEGMPALSGYRLPGFARRFSPEWLFRTALADFAPMKPRNLRHFQAFSLPGRDSRKKDRKGVGFERKMIYLGRHKSWVPGGAHIEMRS
ncbi:MAG: hypothetical protein WB755_08030 [Terriglobales bacterium]